MSLEEQQPRPPAAPSSTKDAWLGFFLCVVLHLLHFLFPAAALAIGLTQWLYVIPMLIVFRNRKGVVQGLLIAAALTFLLNVACFGYFMFIFST